MKKTKLKQVRTEAKMKLREVAERVGVTVSAVHDIEVAGILTPRAAKKYAVAFPGATWKDLMDEPSER